MGDEVDEDGVVRVVGMSGLCLQLGRKRSKATEGVEFSGCGLTFVRWNDLIGQFSNPVWRSLVGRRGEVPPCQLMILS